MAVKRWIPIVAGIAIFVVIVGLGLVGTCAYLVSRQFGVETLSRETGSHEFDKLRSRFEGQRPFIEWPSGEDAGPPVVHREMAQRAAGGVTVVRVRVWSPDDGKLVRVDIPAWALRLMGKGPLKIETGEGAVRRVELQVSAEDIERRGPGLVMDHTMHDGNRILVWSE
jgi:hypothetical protein